MSMFDGRLKWGGNALYGAIFGRPPGDYVAGTRNHFPHRLQKSKWIMGLLHIQRCDDCSGDGWEADCGGPYICPTCSGKGVTRIAKVLKERDITTFTRKGKES